MFEKIEIIAVIFIILTIFYLVISWGAGNKKKTSSSAKIKNYMFNVRILIIFLAVVSIILSIFL